MHLTVLEMFVVKGKESHFPEEMFNKRLNIYDERTYYFYFPFSAAQSSRGRGKASSQGFSCCQS